MSINIVDTTYKLLFIIYKYIKNKKKRIYKTFGICKFRCSLYSTKK